jgi:hypothetical protein
MRGAQELFEAYKRVGLKLEEFEGPRYRRLKHIKSLIEAGKLSDDLRWLQPAVA